MSANKLVSAVIETTTKGAATEGGSGPYCTHLYTETGGRAGRHRGNGAVFGGGSPALGGPSQLYLRGDPPDDLPGGLPGGGGGDANPNPHLQVGALALPVHSSLKGTPPTIFDGNQKMTKQFTQEFMLYRMINKDSSMMKNAYTHTTLALSFMWGPAINDWVIQQTERLY